MIGVGLGYKALSSEPIGHVSILEGKAYGTPLNGVRHELTPDISIAENEYVETKDGGMTIVFLDGTEFRLGSNSSAMMDKFVYDPNASSSLQLGAGVFRFISSAGSDHDGVQIQTPNSVIGIRGTDFVAIIDIENGVTVGTGSGLIEVSSYGTNEVSPVAPGQYSTISPNGSITVQDAPVSADELICWLSKDSYICNQEVKNTEASPVEKDDTERESPEPNNTPSDSPSPDNPGDPVNDPADPGPNDPGSDPNDSGDGGGYDGG